MGNLSVSFYGDNPDKDSPFRMVSTSIANIECDDVLEGLAILHERLNAVAMPRIHQEAVKSTAGAATDEILEGLRSEDKFVTISC